MKLLFVSPKAASDPLVAGQHIARISELDFVDLIVDSVESADVPGVCRRLLGLLPSRRFRDSASFWIAILRQGLRVRRRARVDAVPVVWVRSAVSAFSILILVISIRRDRRPRIVFDPRGFIEHELKSKGRLPLLALQRFAIRTADVCIATTTPMLLELERRGAHATALVRNSPTVSAGTSPSRPTDRLGMSIDDGSIFPIRMIYVSSRETWHSEAAVIDWIATLRRHGVPIQTVAVLRTDSPPDTSLLSAFNELHTNLSPTEVYEVARSCDIGISMILPTIGKLLAASPVKVEDYIACGLTPFCNWELPEHTRLCDGGRTGVLVPLDPNEMGQPDLEAVIETILNHEARARRRSRYSPARDRVGEIRAVLQSIGYSGG